MRRVSLVPAALLAAVVLAAPPAEAGGPTSVLLSVPGADSTTSLYYTDPQYDELADLVGVSQPSGTFLDDSAQDDSAQDDSAQDDSALEDSSASPPRQRGAGVTLTWLIHDVEPWRVDRILLAKDGPWISTQIWTGGGSLGESPAVWHRPADPDGLVALLDRLGVDTKAAQEPGFEGVAGAPVPEQEPAAEPAPVADEPAAAALPPAEQSSWTDGAGWALAGLAGGLLVALALTRRRQAVRSTAGEPERTPAEVDVPAEVLAR